MQSIKSYRDLEVWRKAMELAKKCYEATTDFPKRENAPWPDGVVKATGELAEFIHFPLPPAERENSVMGKE